jgi:hypothetical protein
MMVVPVPLVKEIPVALEREIQHMVIQPVAVAVQVQLAQMLRLHKQALVVLEKFLQSQEIHMAVAAAEDATVEDHLEVA